MNSLLLAEFKQKTNSDDFIKYLKANGVEATKSFYGLSEGNFRELKKYWNITFTQAEKTQLSKKTWQSKDTSIDNQVNKLKEKISKNDLLQYYEVENHTHEETAKHFEISVPYLFRLFREYNINKSKEAHTIKIKESKLSLYGDENYNNRLKAEETTLEKYGVKNVSQADFVREKISNSWKTSDSRKNMRSRFLKTTIEKYGSLDVYYAQKYQKTSETTYQRYGVDNAAKLESTKEKIAKSLKETFLDKYGVECYWQTPDCKKSFASVHSSYNDAFANLLEEYHINYEREFSISRYSYDFKVGNILIEINPFATHNSTWSPFGNAPKDKNYHQDKTKIAIENGYRCINVWDWDDIDKIVSLLLPKEKIYARKCHIKLIDDISVVDSFLNIYHLQETCKGQLICLGLYFENKLVQLMTFGKPRYNKNYEYELLRLCSDSNYIIVGGAEKLFKYFISNYFPKSIISYCDNSKFSGDVYYRLGMSLSKYGTPSAHWYSPELNKHITDNLLRQQGFDRLLGKDFGSFGKNTDNEELMIFHGFVKIFDCGQSVFEWKNV